MVKRNILETNTMGNLAIIFLAVSMLILPLVSEHNSLAGCTTSGGSTSCTESMTFNVNVNEVLTVAITRPDAWASGTISSLLTNKIGVSVISNNPAGFTATMKSATATPDLVNQADSSFVIPTLASDTAASSFPSKGWGYNFVDSGDAAPTTYKGMSGSGDTPIEIASSTTASGVVATDVYFAAKADSTIASGTYSNSVIISVVSGVITDANDDPNDNPITPVNPITPSDDTTPNDGNATVISDTTKGNSPTDNIAVATTTATDTTVTPNTTTTTTESYAAPAGVTEKTTSTATINEGTPLATGLAITAGIAAVTGAAFFVASKHHSYEEFDDGSEDY